MNFLNLSANVDSDNIKLRNIPSVCLTKFLQSHGISTVLCTFYRPRDPPPNTKPHLVRVGFSVWWRCRESNPGPLALTQSFYGRSPLNVFSALTLTRTCSQRTHLQLISPDAPATLHQGKPSSDARLRVEGALGLTDFYRLCSEGEISGSCTGAYSFARVIG